MTSGGPPGAAYDAGGPGRLPGSVLFYLYDLSGGGVERLTLSLIDEFRRRDVRVVLCLHAVAGDLLPMLPADLPIVSFATRRMVADVMPLARVLRQERPDILLSSLGHNNLVALVAKAVGLSRTKVIICQHNALSREASQPGAWKYQVVPLLYRVLSPLAAGIVAVSRGVAQDLAQVAHIARHRITVIYNPVVGVDFEALLDGPAPDTWLDQPGPPVFVNAGRLVAQKDHATLLRAFALVLRRMPARLLILGKGPLRAELERLAVELRIAEHVRFLGFVVNPLPYFRRAAAFVLSSRYEGLGNVLIEAMACGTPVITTDCPYGPAEIVEDGRFGRLVAPQDAPALAAAFSPDLRQLWPPELLRRRASDFTTRQAASQYLALMHRVLSRRPVVAERWQ